MGVGVGGVGVGEVAGEGEKVPPSPLLGEGVGEEVGVEAGGVDVGARGVGEEVAVGVGNPAVGVPAGLPVGNPPLLDRLGEGEGVEAAAPPLVMEGAIAVGVD